MTNLFPLPYWAPALQRVPTPFRVLNEAFAYGEHSLEGGRLVECDADGCPGLARVSPIAKTTCKTRGKKREMARRQAQALWSLWSAQLGV